MSLPSSQVITDGGFRLLNRGPLSISGITKIDGIGAPCHVRLHTEDSQLVGTCRSNTSGAYSFPDLANGDYYLTILDDRQGLRRAKIEHVRL